MMGPLSSVALYSIYLAGAIVDNEMTTETTLSQSTIS